LTHLGDPEGFYKLTKDQQVAIVAHHRITTTPRKSAKSHSGMSVEQAAAHFAKTEAIQKMKKKRARERADSV
jgi:hypothetical protein